MTLRQYQQNAIDELRNGLRSGTMRQCLTIPTGGGKTRIAGGIIEMATSKRKRVAFICNRIELVLQAFDAFKRLGIDCGIIQGDNSINTGASVLVCSIQTIARRGVPDADIYIIDECHCVPGSDAFLKMMEERNAIPVIGLTATPFAKAMAKDFKGVGTLFERLVVGATIPQLISEGFLVDCDIYAPSEPDLTGVKIVAGDYQEDQLAEAVDKPKLVGDIVEHYRKLANGKKTIVFATSINHSKHIVECFKESGYRAVHLDAYTKADERREIINGFKRGDFEILSNCSLLSEGFDCPETEVIILARPTKSLIRYIQMSGRALRISDNISECYNSYRSQRDGIQRGHAVENGPLPRNHGSDCCSVEVRCSQEVVVPALELSKRQLLNKEGTCLSAIIESREGQKRYGELSYGSDERGKPQRSSLGCDGVGGEHKREATSKSQGWEQAEQPRRQSGLGDESGKHEAWTRAWVIPGAQWREAREEQANDLASDGNKAGIEGLSLWVIDETGTKVRSADNNHRGDKSWKVLGACFIAESKDEVEHLARALSNFHKGSESLLVCSNEEDTGRAVRVVGARRLKKKALILDHSGTVKRLGFPTDDLPMILDDGKKKEKQEAKPKPKICKSCFAVRPANVKVCPVCGFEPKMTEQEIIQEIGELKKVEKKKGSAMSLVEKQDIYSALLGFAREKGLKDGFAYYKFEEIVGCFPANTLAKTVGPMVQRVKDYLTHSSIKRAKAPKRNKDECPKCHKVNEYVMTPSAGPHGNGCICKCGAHWWQPKAAA